MKKGMLYFLGHREDQYHIKGNHVSRQKVLSHLLMLPGVEEAEEVIGEKQANGDDRLIAFLSGQVPASDARLMSLLAGRLRAWEIPHRILRGISIRKHLQGRRIGNGLSCDGGSSFFRIRESNSRPCLCYYFFS